MARHKIRLVARGFIQREGLDYYEVYAKATTKLDQICVRRNEC